MKREFENANDNSNLDNMKLALHPLGIMPQDIWIQMRVRDLQDAITRYTDANLEIPNEWITEYNGLIQLVEKVNIRRANNKQGGL